MNETKKWSALYGFESATFKCRFFQKKSCKGALLVMLFLFIVGTNVNAQETNTVSGKVADESGQPLPSVTVIIQGTTDGTVTNAEGN